MSTGMYPAAAGERAGKALLKGSLWGLGGRPPQKQIRVGSWTPFDDSAEPLGFD